MKASESVQNANFTAIVHSADGVLFVATAECPQRLAAQVVTYIRGRCGDVLWPSDAQQVREFIVQDKPYAAIALYFAKVGERWDEERLELGGLSFGPLRAPRALAEVG